jgi:hypothetical protein
MESSAELGYDTKERSIIIKRLLEHYSIERFFMICRGLNSVKYYRLENTSKLGPHPTRLNLLGKAYPNIRSFLFNNHHLNLPQLELS